MFKVALTALATLAAATVTAVPASAAGQANATGCGLGLACFYDTVWANTKPANYPNPGSNCTALPFVAKALINGTDRPIALYGDTNCTHLLLVEPARNFHSYPSHSVRAFRAQ
ncbi:hypothetical protein HPO96_05430 [Kribbella sandramycini]|uniref:Peptidase inhibitor family I36 n=1 Tax=Kribbella sandramycini TaxID=60450 RepID=A0A7Y4KVZ4_9ACTN|nr:hypothetical protein [Kribbella sandramycini]MBB6567721.1 hypothetical protein [Kribbella sandramycini]NOL39682.1 hypothetical protein [Kribbella sandramycini]